MVWPVYRRGLFGRASRTQVERPQRFETHGQACLARQNAVQNMILSFSDTLDRGFDRGSRHRYWRRANKLLQ